MDNRGFITRVPGCHKVLHTLRSISPDVGQRIKTMFEKLTNGFYPQVQGRFLHFIQQLYESLVNVAAFRQYICKELAKNGCLIFMPDMDDPDTFELRSSSIDFIPSFIHDGGNIISTLRKGKLQKTTADSSDLGSSDDLGSATEDGTFKISGITMLSNYRG